MTVGAIKMTKRTAHAFSGAPEWERAKRRRACADMLDAACGHTERTLKGIASCAGVPDSKLRAMRRGDHGVDLATALGLPERVRDALFEQVAATVGREWVEGVEPEQGDFDDMLAKLRDSFEDAMRELREVQRTRQVSAETARKLLGPVRTARRLLTGIEVLAERALKERGVSVDEEGDE